MKRNLRLLYYLFLFLPFIIAFVLSQNELQRKDTYEADLKDFANKLFDEGQKTFRDDTFGSEIFWGDQLKLHDAIKGDSLGGVGPGLTPIQALLLGLKVDVDALPQEIKDGITNKTIDLNSAATTVALLKLNAVLGVKGIFNGDNLESIGLMCSSCHSTVDNSFMPGIGKRLDGWANRDLNVGEIIAFAPNLDGPAALLGVDTGTVRAVVRSWGPGKFDAELFFDGKAFRPDKKSAATLIPSAFGLAGVNLHTYTGWGSVTHWNALVSNLEMHGQGTFYDPRLKDAQKFPIAAANGMYNVRGNPDLITSKLAALHFYQLGLPSPKPPDGFFDESAAMEGEMLFNGKAKCATCHVPPLFTEPGWNMHTPEEMRIDDFQAKRSPDEHYRTTPLKGLWTRMKGGFYHDGRFATLNDVLDHYNTCFSLGLSPQEKNNIVEYLKSLGDEDVFMGSASINDIGELILPGTNYLYQNYPNPFNPATKIKYQIPQSGNVKLTIFDPLGKEIATLVNKYQDKGSYEVELNASNLASGIYIYKLEVDKYTSTKKMVLIR